MARKPLIMMSASHDYDPVWHTEQYILNKNYPAAVVAGGGIPAMAVDSERAEDYAKLADGLVLTGGWMLNPASVSSGFCTAEDQAKYINEVRNPYDWALYRAFRDRGKPVLGICQGLLAINVAQGGELNYDLPGVFGVEHGNGIAHIVNVEPGSVIARLFGERVLVNSHHTHFVSRLGEDLKVIAWSPEGVPEALVHVALPILGVQWHPERMRGDLPNPPKGPDMTRLFSYFVGQCQQNVSIKSEEHTSIRNEKPVVMVTGEHGISAKNMGCVPVYILNKAYSRSVSAAGGIPLTPLGPCMEESYCEMSDGLLLTGGSNIHSGRYNTPFFDEESASGVSYDRDNIEFDLFQACFKAKKPIMGIGRGQQLINVALGGTLIQNLRKLKDAEHGGGCFHPVHVETGSILKKLFGKEFHVNSFHQQAVDRIGSALHISARAADGVPEALEHDNLPIFSVQFHPELMHGNFSKGTPDMRALFEYFIGECREGRKVARDADIF